MSSDFAIKEVSSTESRASRVHTVTRAACFTPGSSFSEVSVTQLPVLRDWSRSGLAVDDLQHCLVSIYRLDDDSSKPGFAFFTGGAWPEDTRCSFTTQTVMKKSPQARTSDDLPFLANAKLRLIPKLDEELPLMPDEIDAEALRRQVEETAAAEENLEMGEMGEIALVAGRPSKWWATVDKSKGLARL